MNGVLVVDKPAGPTSHDVVHQARKLLKVKQIGHAGTLDPGATGLLVLCVGKATKISPLLMEGDKEYEVGFRLGVQTDTYDDSGQILAEKPVDVSEEQLRYVIDQFLGKQDQKPPIYSAVKVGGKKLYEYAREGKSVEVPIRVVTIHALELTSFAPPQNAPGVSPGENAGFVPRETRGLETPVVSSGNFRGVEGGLKVRCSRGTYIRSLIHDMGQKLGCGAITTVIRRIACGPLHIENAISLTELAEAQDPVVRAQEAMLGIAESLSEYPLLRITPEVASRVQHGAGLRPQDLSACRWDRAAGEGPGTVVIADQGGEALALGLFDGRAQVSVKRLL